MGMMELQIPYRVCTEIPQKRLAIGKILRQLCEWTGVKMIEAEAYPDHIHRFVEIPPKYAVSGRISRTSLKKTR